MRRVRVMKKKVESMTPRDLALVRCFLSHCLTSTQDALATLLETQRVLEKSRGKEDPASKKIAGDVLYQKHFASAINDMFSRAAGRQPWYPEFAEENKGVE